MNQFKTYTCPVCGYAGLDVNPYENMPSVTEIDWSLKPPYTQHWGKASYEVCSCCGFEYGNDDDGMDAASNFSFQDYLVFWVKEEGMRWFDPDLKPAGWSLETQLKGLPRSTALEVLNSTK
jgi:rubredoxin